MRESRNGCRRVRAKFALRLLGVQAPQVRQALQVGSPLTAWNDFTASSFWPRLQLRDAQQQARLGLVLTPPLASPS